MGKMRAFSSLSCHLYTGAWTDAPASGCPFFFFFSAYVNSAAKVFASQPRPFQYDSRVKQIVSTGGGGFPSGHTQGTLVFWGYLALRFRHPFLWVIAGLLIILIPLSRLYLGGSFSYRSFRRLSYRNDTSIALYLV